MLDVHNGAAMLQELGREYGRETSKNLAEKLP